MFDEEGERILHETDLYGRLAAALDGPEAWIKWDLARAIARNIKFKLEEPPQRPIATQFWDRLQAEVSAFVRHFPNLPPEWFSGDRIDDPTVCLPCDLAAVHRNILCVCVWPITSFQ